MPSIQEMREERTAKAREYRNLLDKNPGKLSDEVKAKLDALESDISGLEDAISRHEKALAMEADKTAAQAVDEAGKRAGRDAKDPVQALFAKWLRGGDKALSAEDWKTINATMSTGTGSEGGYTVPTETARTVLDALKAFGGMRSVATVITTASGHSMSWPTSDGTAETGELVGENAAAADLDISFGTLALPVYKYSSKVVAVPIELLQDSGVDLEAFIRARLVQRLGRITNTHFTTGTGSSQPRGIVTASSAGKTGTTGQTATVIFEDLVDLEHSVDPAYRMSPSCGWMFADSTLKVLKKLKDGDGRPLWLPGLSAKEPATILNYGYTINQDVASMAANAKSILFGDLGKYVIRDAMQMTFYRFDDSAYAKKGQVGFLAFLRSGGNFMDVGGAVKHYANSAS